MMKKLLFLVISLFLFSSVSAREVVQFKALSDRCAFLSEGEITVHVRLLSLNTGDIFKVIPKYNIGKVYNGDGKKNLSIRNIKGKVKGIEVDNVRDQNDYSNVYIIIAEDLRVNAMEEILSFDVIYEFGDKVLDNVYVLGSEVVVSERKEVCAALNSFDFYNEGDQSFVLEENESKGSFPKMIILVVLLVIFVLSLLIVRRKVLH